MRHFCFISISVFFALFIPTTTFISPVTANGNYLPPPAAAPAPRYLNDIINSTCLSCSDISSIFDYSFCVTTMQAVPASHAVDLRGLAIISMELALENATRTIAKIEKLILSQQFDPLTTKCLKHCLDAYADSVSNVVMAMGAFMADQPATANNLMGSVVEEPMNCESEFRHKKGEIISPLAKENYDLFEIGILTICIINQASSVPPFLQFPLNANA